MMSQFYKYKLKYRKKLSLYYTHDIFSSLDETFCDSTQNCPLWVTISVRRKFFILFWFEGKFKDEKLLQVEAVDVAKGDGGVTQKSTTLLFIACLREI